MSIKRLAKAFFLIGLLVGKSLTSSAQKFSLEDLLTIYAADTSSFQQIADRNSFLLDVNRDVAVLTTFTFVSKSNEKIFLKVTVSNQPMGQDRSFNYWFNIKEDYKAFKKDLKSAGFKWQMALKTPAPIKSFGDMYKKDELSISLSTSKTDPPYMVWIF